MLLELMAGRLSYADFRELIGDEAEGENMFERLLQSGHVIRRAQILQLAHADDDHIVLEFERDVSAAPYRKASDA
jgi:hypothetical protein